MDVVSQHNATKLGGQSEGHLQRKIDPHVPYYFPQGEVTEQAAELSVRIKE